MYPWLCHKKTPVSQKDTGVFNLLVNYRLLTSFTLRIINRAGLRLRLLLLRRTLDAGDVVFFGTAVVCFTELGLVDGRFLDLAGTQCPQVVGGFQASFPGGHV